MQRRAHDEPKITFAWHSEVAAIRGTDQVTGVELRDLAVLPPGEPVQPGLLRGLYGKAAAAYVAEATHLARTKGSISSYLYSTDEAFIDRSTPLYEQAGANLTINLTGAMWINFAAAYSDYHVSGLNPAGNACLADLAFVAARFRIVQRRRPTA